MKYNVLTYLIGEGVSNVFKNKKQAITAISMMCVTMLIFGLFFVIVENLNHFVDEIEKDQGMQVYMKKDATEEQIESLKQELQKIEGINTIEYISKEDALQQIKDRFGEKASLLEGHDSSIFPVSFVLTLTDLSKSDQISDQISKLDNIEKVQSKQGTISTLIAIARAVKIGTYVILVCLIIFSVFIITNTIKLTVHARRREISIMKYVGATNGFIRWPFAVEGMIIGLISGAVSVGLLGIIYSITVRNQGVIHVLSKISSGLVLLNFSDMLNLIILVYFILGIVIGILGSVISMRKYLKV